MTRSYIRILGLLLLAYGLVGLAVSDISGWARFGWLEVAAALVAGVGALWIGFRPALAPESLRAARVFSLTLVTVAAFGLWGPIIPEATLEPAEMALWATLGVIGLVVVFRDEASATFQPDAVVASDSASDSAA